MSLRKNQTFHALELREPGVQADYFQLCSQGKSVQVGIVPQLGRKGLMLREAAPMISTPGGSLAKEMRASLK